MSSPTQRTLERCRKNGWRACVVEKWVPIAGKWPGKRKDAFGFGDVLVVDHDRGALLIQACSGGDGAKRVTKILTECHDDARAWLGAGNRIEVWAWRKLGHRWHPLITAVRLPDPGADLGDVLDNLPF